MLAESEGSSGNDPLHPVRLSLDGLLPIRACLHLIGQCQVSPKVTSRQTVHRLEASSTVFERND